MVPPKPVGNSNNPSASEHSASRDDAPLAVGTVVGGRYRVESLIGSGAMGSVYAVDQMFLHKRFALKVLKAVSASDQNVRRFQNEAQAASKLDHPNLVRAVDFGMLDETIPYLIMDYAEGETLAKLLERKGSLSVDEALKLFIPLCFGMAYAHAEQVIHRDIKPSNIVLVKNEHGDIVPKVVDFGIAKLLQSEGQELTKTGEIFGTPLYMSPEQCTGQTIDQRTDIYSFGCVIFESLTGAPPFTGISAMDTLLKHVHQQPQSLKEGSLGQSFPAFLESTVAKMMRKNANARHRNFLEVAEALTAIQRGETSVLHALDEQNSAVSASQPGRKTKLLEIFAVVSAVVLCVAAVVITMQHVRSSDDSLQNVKDPFELRLGAVDPTKPVDYKATILKPAEIIGNQRVFEFGPRRLGRICSRPDPGLFIDIPFDQQYAAQGRVSLPVAEKVWFGFDDATQQSGGTSILRQFDPDLLSGLDINPSEMSRFIAEQDDQSKHLVDDVLFVASDFKNLVCLQTKGPIGPKGLKNLGDMQNLRYLTMRMSGCDADVLAHSPVLHHLKTLRVSQIAHVGKVVDGLKASPNMQNLELRDCDLTARDLKNIAKFPCLWSVNLQGNKQVDDETVKVLLAKKKQLQNLLLAETSITPKSIPTLAQFSSTGWIEVPSTWSEKDLEVLRKAQDHKCTLSIH